MYSIVFSGNVRNSGRNLVASSSTGRHAAVFSGILETPQEFSTILQTTTSVSKLCVVPQKVSPRMACAYTAVLLAAIETIHQEFEVMLTSSHRRPNPQTDNPPSGRRIVILRGETPLGGALTQVLVRTRPDARAVLLSSMSHQRALFQRTSHLVGLGAWYAVDGAIRDLVGYAGLGEEDRVEVILKAVEGAEVREDLQRVSRVVECAGRDRGTASGIVNVEDDGLTGAVYRMLKEAADVMGECVTPSESCGFADDNG